MNRCGIFMVHCKKKQKKKRRFYGKYWQLAASAFTVNFNKGPLKFRRNLCVGWSKDV